MEQQYFAVLHRDDAVWQNSSSGGAFTALTDAWFRLHKEKAVLYGCVLDENLQAVHLRTTDKQGRDRMRGSKYIASDMTGIYPQVANDVQQGRFVLFSGTPCQVAGVRQYLIAKQISTEEHLLTVDLVCHGVGDSRFFGDYIRHLEGKYKSTAVACSFRGKSRPEKIQEMIVTFANGKRYISPAARYDEFLSPYQKGLIMRPSCFRCPFANLRRQADITLGDHWNDQSGRAKSAVIVSSEAGLALMQAAEEAVRCVPVTVEQIAQPNLLAPTKKPVEYDDFTACYAQGGYEAVNRMLGNRTVIAKGKVAVAKTLYILHLTEAIKAVKRKAKNVLG